MTKKLLTICLLFLLSACGAKGDLYLESDSTKQPATETEPPQNKQSSQDSLEQPSS